MTAAERRARAVLDRLPPGPVRGAEVGVHDGRMSVHLLARPDLTLHMVDRWAPPPPGPYGESGDPRATLSAEEHFRAMWAAWHDTVGAHDRRVVHRGESVDVARGLSGLDFVFIDADHTYGAVRADIGAWLASLAPDGLLCGHDYTPRFPGVVRAVDEAAEKFGWTVETGDDTTWFALRSESMERAA